MTNAKQKDLDKIVEQRLSPQYVSIHATDLEARKILLGTKKDDKFLRGAILHQTREMLRMAEEEGFTDVIRWSKDGSPAPGTASP